MEKHYSIGELSREFDITTRAIRFYEDKGLLSPGRAGQNRVFTQRDFVRLRLILRGKRLGFSLGEIRELLDLYDDPGGEVTQLRRLCEKLRERRRALEQQREDIDIVLREMDVIEAQCTDVLRRKETNPA